MKRAASSIQQHPKKVKLFTEKQKQGIEAAERFTYSRCLGFEKAGNTRSAKHKARREAFDTWEATSIRGDLLQAKLVVLDSEIFAPPEQSWEVLGHVHLLGRLTTQFKSEQLTVPYRKLPVKYDFLIQGGAWCDSGKVKSFKIANQPEATGGVILRCPKCPWSVPDQISIGRDPDHTCIQWDHHGGTGFPFCNLQLERQGADHRVKINWKLTRALNQDREVSEFLPKSTLRASLLSELVGIIASYVFCIKPVDRKHTVVFEPRN